MSGVRRGIERSIERSPARSGRGRPASPFGLALLLLALGTAVPPARATESPDPDPPGPVRLEVFVGDHPPCADGNGLPLEGCIDTRRAAGVFSIGPGEAVALGREAPAPWPERLLLAGPGGTVLTGPLPAGAADGWSLRVIRPEDPQAPPWLEVRLRAGAQHRERLLRRWPATERWEPVLTGMAGGPAQTLWLRSRSG
jgi:hypothetical protein